MQVTIDNIRIAGSECDPVKTQVSNFNIEVENAVEVVQYVRSKTVAVFDRGNLVTTISFQVTRIHRDTRHAELFILNHGDEVPRSGLVTFTARTPHVEGWAEESQRFMQATCIQTHQCSYNGCTTRHSYRMIGGEISNRRP